MATRKQSFVTFLSPGTFVAEETSRPVELWDIKTAVKMAKSVSERHGAKPYCFFFTESVVADDIDDGFGGKLKIEPRCVRKSGMHFIDGKLWTVESLQRRNDPKDAILILNMRGNQWKYVCETTNSWRHVGQFDEKKDCVVSSTGDVLPNDTVLT